uniref:Uncharacterized protein n=1 Tax=Piliocolobus tephrosceles TaxID=591936 RepID=A0A8C9GXH4_9PRIM
MNSGCSWEKKMPATFWGRGDGVLLCGLGWSAVERSWFTSTSDSRVQAILLPQLPN